MRTKLLRNRVVPILAALVVMPTQASGLEVNQFYKTFVSLLKESQASRLERYVGENIDTASKCLTVVREKISIEKDPQRSQAYRLIDRELSELIAVNRGQEDCAGAEKIFERGLNSAVLEEKVAAFRRVVRLCPGHTEGRLGMAESNRRLGKFDEAVDGYEKVLGMKPDSPLALMGMSQTLYAAGLYRRCVPYLQRIVNVDPTNKAADKISESAKQQIAQDKPELITAEQIVDRLWNPLEGKLMCMCPSRVPLISRVRLRLVTFSTESIWLDRNARAQLAELAKAFKTPALKDGHYLIEGHTDSIGAADYNQSLSTKRGEAAKKYMVKKLGVDPSLLSVLGMGESRQWTTNRTPEGRRNNRRIEIISIGKVGDKDLGKR